jgi:inosose dehydratase
LKGRFTHLVQKLVSLATHRLANDDFPNRRENTFHNGQRKWARGFSGTEIGNKYPSDASTLKHMLDVRGLRIASRWFSSFLISKPLEENVKAFEAELAFLAAVGAKAINVSEQSYSVQGMEKTPIFGHKYVMNEQEWGLLTNGLNVLGKIAAEKGFRLCFHHHMGTVVQTAEETTRMLDETDAKYVHLCYDTGHFVFTGADPVAMLKKYVNRVGHVHLKTSACRY